MIRPLLVAGLAGLLSMPLPAQTAAADEYDGCALVSAADVEAVIGEKLQRQPRPKRLTMLSVESYGCNYKSELWTVEVRLETGRDAEGIKEYLKTLKGVVKQTTASDARSVPGLGDEAWWGPVNPTNGMLHVARGTDLIWVQTYGKGAGAGSLEKTRAITEKVLAGYNRLKKS